MNTNLITTSHRTPCGRIIALTRNPLARDGERIIEAIISPGAGWPLESLRVILDEHQRHANEQNIAFKQIFRIPGGLHLKFSFEPGKPYLPCPLVEEVKDYRTDVLEAIKRRFTPERMAQVFAGLPAAGQRRVALDCLVEPPVRRTVKITRRPKSK